MTIAVALVTLAALVAGGVARLDDRGEITTELVTADLATAPTTSTPVADDLAPTGPPIVAAVPDKAAAVAAQWEAAEVAAAQLAYAEAARRNEAAAEAAAAEAAAPVAEQAPARTPAAPAPTPTQPTPTQPPPTPPPSGGGNIYAKLDNIARCESGMNPKAYNPAGYYGAFQFSLATWRGLGESGDPRDRSYSYQREVAKRLQARSGWGQWPHCSAQYGYR